MRQVEVAAAGDARVQVGHDVKPDVLRGEKALLGCLCALFLCRALLASAIVPPWQGADEPTHYTLIKLLARPDRDALDARAEIERPLFRSLARHRWWESFGELTPNPLPASTVIFAGQRLGGGESRVSPVYYMLASAVLRVAPAGGVDAEYATLRRLSLLLSVLALACGWAGTRLLFGPLTALGATAIAALHPQFLLCALTVNPDSLVNVWGAFIWWQVARLIRRPASIVTVGLILVASGAALITKRSGVALVAASGVSVSLILAAQMRRRLTRRDGMLVGLPILVGVAAVIAASFVFQIQIHVRESFIFQTQLRHLVSFLRGALTPRRSATEGIASAVWGIITSSVDSAWLIAGWMRFPAPEPWRWVARGLTVAGLVGSIGMAVRSAGVRREVCLAGFFVAMQIASIYATAYRNVVAPEGRFMFPVLAPAMALLWVGLMWLTPAPARRHAAPVLLTVFALLDLTAFTTVLIPAYVP